MRYKIVSAIITLGILIILIISGPAEAFILGLTILNPDVQKGEEISFTGTIEIESGEFLDIQNIILYLSGPMNIECMFNVNGSIISGCPGIQVQQIETTDYSYGYGFSEGNLSYKIILDSSEYIAGIYSTSWGIALQEGIIKENGADIIIRTIIEELGACSIRADDGSLDVEEESFGNNNHLNFYVPKGNAVTGQGSLTAQFGRTRFSYSFDIVEILENDNEHAIFLVSGKYRIHLGEEKPENAVIFFDKINNKISLSSKNINLEKAEISFREKC